MTKLQERLEELKQQYLDGILSQGEFYAKCIEALDSWFRQQIPN